LVKRETNPKYYDLIKFFGDITGVPVILNSSFNVRGEPIVCTPSDAIKCFYDTGLDYLAIGDFLIDKK
jgi:carbamoyltransferase